MKSNVFTILLAVMVACLFIAGPAVGADGDATLSRDEAYRLVLSDVLKGNTDGKWIFAAVEPVGCGSAIDTWYGSIELPSEDGWLFFIDDRPMESWAHPCRYVHVDMAGVVIVRDAYGPPEDLITWDKVGGSLPSIETVATTSRAIEAPVVMEAIPACEHSDHCYAVLISGGANEWNNWPRYWGDISFMYKTLVNDYGYQEGNIYVLMSDGTDPGLDMHTQTDPDPEVYEDSPLDLDGDGDDDVEDSATSANIATVFDMLGGALAAGDHLFIFTTDHGGPINDASGVQIPGRVLLNLWYDSIDDDEFALEVDKISPDVPITIAMEQCYSGGFIDDIIHSGLAAPQQRTITTAANDHESSYGDTFSTLWISAVAGHDKSGTVVDADANVDGVVSMKEAFDYAEAHDGQPEHPQYGEYPAAIGDSLALSSCYAPILPVANAGNDTSVEQTALAGTPVTPDGSGSYDPCGMAIAAYSWTWTGGSATGVSPTVTLPLGTTIISLTVTADGRTSEPDTVAITVQDTTPPVLAVPDDVTVEQATGDGTVVPLTANATDICDAAPVITSDAPAIFPLGTTTVTFTATDASGNTATGTTTVTVVDTTPPVLTVPADVTVEQATGDGTVVPLTATATDICDAAPVITSDAPAIFPLGTTTVTFTATDASGNTATGTTTVTVVDTTPPVISVAVTPDILWPANHKMVEIQAIVTATDICDAAPVTTLVSITSNEPDDDIGIGDGDTTNDIQITGGSDYAFKLRAERAGTGDGRIYTITYTATDFSGNSASASAIVSVPHEK